MRPHRPAVGRRQPEVRWTRRGGGIAVPKDHLIVGIRAPEYLLLAILGVTFHVQERPRQRVPCGGDVSLLTRSVGRLDGVYDPGRKTEVGAGWGGKVRTRSDREGCGPTRIDGTAAATQVETATGYAACFVQPLTSSGVMRLSPDSMADSRAVIVRAFCLRSQALNLDQASSMGLNSGEYGGV